MSAEGEGDCATVNKGEGDASNLGDGTLLGSSKAKDVGNISNKDYMRADKIDFKSWDLQLEKHLSKVWSKDKEAPTTTNNEEWEIDLAKLDIRNVIAHGTYGTVYKGAYDGQDVAGLDILKSPANLESSMEKLCNTHVKLLALDFNSLTPIPSGQSTFSRNGTPTPLSRAESIGIITTRDLKPNKFLRFTVDDGTGCIPCVLWLNHLNSPYFSRRNPSDVRLIADVAARLASDVHLGVVARVRGRITGYRGTLQITVTDVSIERDPNAEIRHWLQCIKLSRKCYDVLPCPK